MKRKILLAAIPLMVSSALIASEEYGCAVPCPTSSYVPMPIPSLSAGAWEGAAVPAPLSTEELARRALEGKKKIEECSSEVLNPLAEWIYESDAFRDKIIAMWSSTPLPKPSTGNTLPNPCSPFLEAFYEIRAIEEAAMLGTHRLYIWGTSSSSIETRLYPLTNIDRFWKIAENTLPSGEPAFRSALELCKEFTLSVDDLETVLQEWLDFSSLRNEQSDLAEERIASILASEGSALAQKRIAWILASEWSTLLDQAEKKLVDDRGSGKSFKLRVMKKGRPLEYCQELMKEVGLENLMSRIEPLIDEIFTSLIETK